MEHLVGEDFSRGDVVAVGKPARDDQELRLAQRLGILHQGQHVDAGGGETGLLEGELGLAVAIGPGRTEDDGFGSNAHGGILQHAPVVSQEPSGSL